MIPRLLMNDLRAALLLTACVLGCGARTSEPTRDPCAIPDGAITSELAIALGRCDANIGPDARVAAISGQRLDAEGRATSWSVWFVVNGSTTGQQFIIDSGSITAHSVPMTDDCVAGRDPAPSGALVQTAWTATRAHVPSSVSTTDWYLFLTTCRSGKSTFQATWDTQYYAVALVTWDGAVGDACGPCFDDGPVSSGCPPCF